MTIINHDATSNTIDIFCVEHETSEGCDYMTSFYSFLFAHEVALRGAVEVPLAAVERCDADRVLHDDPFLTLHILANVRLWCFGIQPFHIIFTIAAIFFFDARINLISFALGPSANARAF